MQLSQISPVSAQTSDGGRTWKHFVLPILEGKRTRCPDPFAGSTKDGILFIGCEPRETDPVAVDPPGGTAFQQVDKGNPIVPVYPSDGTSVCVGPSSVMASAPHPNAARLFIDHFLSDEFQAELARLGLLPVTSGAADALPAELAPFARAKLLGGMTPDTQEQRLKFAAEVYK